MGRAIGFVISIFVLFFLVVVAYQVGVSTAMNVGGQVASGAGMPYWVGHPFSWGFGLGFGLLLPLLFIALIAGLMSAFRGGPYGVHARWIEHRRTMLEEWHREAHRAEPQRPSDTTARRDV
jgi:hypothetical protein